MTYWHDSADDQKDIWHWITVAVALAQTIGLNSGYFLSFTVFLALNSADFANKYFRSVPSDLPFVSLASYLKFWGLAFIAVTAYLLSVHTDVRR